jgi:hypothetical protein
MPFAPQVKKRARGSRDKTGIKVYKRKQLSVHSRAGVNKLQG